MRPIVQEIATSHSPASLARRLRDAPGLVLLHSAALDFPQARYSFVTARPYLTLRTWGSRGVTSTPAGEVRVHFGNPWHLLDALMARYEVLDEVDLPFPLGGCFGFWGYDLNRFTEPRRSRRPLDDLELPDCQAGFHDSLVVFDHHLGRVSVISTGLRPDGSRDEARAVEALEGWRRLLEEDPDLTATPDLPGSAGAADRPAPAPVSTFSRAGFLAAVERARRYIHQGDIYQVNLAQRLSVPAVMGGWDFYERLAAVSPAPFAAYVAGDGFQLACSSPELFLRLSGSHATTRPIKGTRPRSADPTRDAQLSYELQTSAKEMSELVMITDLLRNDLGRVCEYGSVQVPELVRLERHPQVQHLVSTVEGRLRPGVTHGEAFARCFPGGSITGAPKIRAMEIIDELEPVTRGPYTGCLGYLGFNRESQLNIAIRTAVCRADRIHFHAGAGIVADSSPEAEHEETLAKAAGFLAAAGAGRGVPQAAGGRA
ncbi:MAG: aminodeoxychorismate synthase component 1 [Verrucomicrobiota bacterium]|jgi:para-aminobenzoate synthetase component 1